VSQTAKSASRKHHHTSGVERGRVAAGEHKPPAVRAAGLTNDRQVGRVRRGTQSGHQTAADVRAPVQSQVLRHEQVTLYQRVCKRALTISKLALETRARKKKRTGSGSGHADGYTAGQTANRNHACARRTGTRFQNKVTASAG
jgi:hypothetical protein